MKNNKIGFYASIGAVLVVIAVFAWIAMSDAEHQTQDEQSVLSIVDLYQEVNLSFDNNQNKAVLDYINYEAGDEVIVKDTIFNISVFEINPSLRSLFEITEYTQVQFKVSEEIQWNFFIRGNITDQFSQNDVVEIRYHLKQFNYNKTNPTTQQVSFYEREVPLEGFNKEYFLAMNRVLIPNSSIEKIN